MGADASRDVVLTLTLKASEGNQEEANRIYDSIRNARQRLHTESVDAIQKEAQERAAAAGGEKSENDRRRQEITEAIDALAKRRQEAAEKRKRSEQEAADVEIRAQEKLSAEVERSSEKAITAAKARREASMGAARGALDAVKGFALLGLSSEEDTAKFLRMFAVIEGGFNVVRGLSELWYKTAEAVRAYQTELKAVAAAQAAQAALSRSQVATGAAAGAVPAGGIGAGATAGAGTAAAGTAAGLGVAATAGLAVAVVAIGDLLMGLADPTNSVILNFLGLAETAKERKRQEAETLALIERNNERLRMQDQDIAAARSARSGLIAGAIETRNLSGLDAGERARLAAGDVAIARGRMAEFQRESSGAAIGNADIRQFIREEGTDRGQELADALRRQAEAQKEIVDARRQSLDLAEREVETARRNVEQVEKRIEAERKGYETRQAAFGRLSAPQQAQLRRISERARNGDIGERDARLLDSLGFGRGLSDEFFAGKGRAAGGDAILSGLGERAGLDAASADLASAIGQRVDAEKKAAEASRDVSTAMADMVPTVAALNEALQQLAKLQTIGSYRTTGQIGSSGINEAERRRANGG